MVGKVRAAAGGDLVVNMSNLLMAYTSNLTARATFGDDERWFEDGGELKRVFGDFEELLGVAAVGELIPWLQWVDRLTGTERKLARTAEALTRIVERVIEGRRRRRVGRCGGRAEEKAFVDVLLEVNETDEEVEIKLDDAEKKAIMLGLITTVDRVIILEGLDQIGRLIQDGKFEWRKDREDVHMNIEAALIEKVGEPAKKLHTARSRNDQIVTDLRLWCRDAIDRILTRIKHFQVDVVHLSDISITIVSGVKHHRSGKEWVRSTRPYPISISLRTIRDILDANKPMDHDCFNMPVRTVACNIARLFIEDKYHFMDLKFCDMFAAGTNTSYTVMEWTMAELMNNPHEMSKLQQEIRTVVGKDKHITEEHSQRMDYLKLVIKESLRLHSPVPLLAPRETLEDTELLGYQVPARTRVLINAWAIARDKESWERPEEFCPERFADVATDYKGKDFQLIPFGAGRRGCPGIGFAMTAIELALANLMYHFDWELPDGRKPGSLDMTEEGGIAVHMKYGLHLVAKPYNTFN